ncbi:MAG: ATP-dependent DNA helicase RecG [Candidatus Nomurabacteria bacterium GW2011_GWF2_35_66]|uniref:Probable DNA 3'-5' helicase RecG n=1 Tax=Candidatus Nomurabacteria bacterium GW2011_GWE1_35_16 TaxID=1618761 RepID=A0A0G0EHP3_9BACT|nr:MAG: ATP-dependent DNA helicase RecG [Candidatus Nomurabacteria bacterium GW2011_GWF1_34_20]KKP63590.1 MAG: ATP-dependent DNA helicase RecG [Candidatus Nomurabacteria bacterium GW2011_GWE2_34_25]KKP66792.1 MAG: ATP-dependent DNA helicase RecG [Candidatus Nomurabacteria bacterium GW2011_GWE1_35_16]KKP83418.1 MAG: ATP-dependent DNA helicase RecG [Candidatus Nomurabacteria bacterium GW2011_GWF2_35_66]HAE36648.1 DNA helicase RecG [Candidatus Nomurabacteria bacterium]
MNLADKIENHFRIDINQKKALRQLDLITLKDLLYHFPSRYSDISEVRNINTLADGENVTILGKISSLKTKKGFKSKIPMGQAILSDLTGSINIVWFHQPYLAKMLKEGSTVRVTGKVTESKTYGLTLTNPEITKEDILPIDIHDSLFSNKGAQTQFGFPVYRESRGITSKWFYHAIQKILKQDCTTKILDYIPTDILNTYKLPALHTALFWVHMPQKKEHAEIARKRFAFEEVFFVQLARQQEKKKYESLFSYKLKIPHKDINDFISRFPFTPTKAQTGAIDTILDDLVKDKPMSRLIEGDVGSGKTFVAATVAYAVIKNTTGTSRYGDFGNLQVAYMAPTEVLATQLFENFIGYFEHTGISIALMTGSGCRKYPSKSARWENGAQVKTWTTISKSQLLKWIKNGEIPIVVGTHALISKTVEFENLGLVIIDEQHRFGTNQRMKLAKKDGHAPHYLSMTATPIPRTLALTIYGDLDLSIIDEMPEGRKKVITEIVPENKRVEAYEKIKKELAEGRQLYVICPKIEGSEEVGHIIPGSITEDDGPSTSKKPSKVLLRADGNNMSDLKAVTTEARRLKKDIFPNYNIDIMHSKMTKDKKEKVMKDFAEKKIDILVSTSVIEVGVNVPNATVIIIEGSERFGLAQLHQLRGRVIRSNHQSYCYLFADAKSEKTIDRLKALTKATNGFELAELDLQLRGAGLLSGDKQWGITDLGMEAIKNIKMVEAARTEAIRIIEKDEDLKKYPILGKTLLEKNLKLHFE